MQRKKYKEYLKKNGYKIINDNYVSLGKYVFNIVEDTINTAIGKQKTFYLKMV